MTRALPSFAGIVLPLTAAALLGCQSPWQSGAPVAGDGGWFSWLATSERTDPLERLAGGGSYSPGVAEADSGAELARQRLYGDRASQLDLSRSGAQSPQGLASQSTSPTTLAEALPSDEDDVAGRVVRSLQSRQQATASPAVAEVADASQPGGAVAPAGYQAPAGYEVSAGDPAPAGPTAFVTSTGASSGTVAGTAPPSAQSNPFYDPFGEGPRAASSSASISAGRASSSGSSALRLLTTPTAPATESAPALSVPSGSSDRPTGSLLRLLGDNPLREDGPATGE